MQPGCEDPGTGRLELLLPRVDFRHQLIEEFGRRIAVGLIDAEQVLLHPVIFPDDAG
jgi:hypothetical protein